MTGPSIRQRSVDITRKLKVYRSREDLDDDEEGSLRSSQIISHTAEKSVQIVSKSAKRDIPTPRVETVPTYETDYPANFKQPSTYIRSRLARSEYGDYIEYDLDDEDDHWLSVFNQQKTIIEPEVLEWMLYRVEILDHKERERAGMLPMVLGNHVPLLLQLETAREVLKIRIQRQAVITAVFNYWRAKREKWKVPILRRLQPEPACNDQNPHSVFRPREKNQRLHTRRNQKKENGYQSFEKLKAVRKNILEAKTILLGLRQRELRKKELAEMERDLHEHVLAERHDAPAVQGSNEDTPQKKMEQNDAPGTLLGGGKPYINGHVAAAADSDTAATASTQGAAGPAMAAISPSDSLLGKRHGRQAFAKLDLPKKRAQMDPVLAFTQPMDMDKLTSIGLVPFPRKKKGEIEEDRMFSRFRGRIGRGGRLIFDRWNVLEGVPLTSQEKGATLTSSVNVVAGVPSEGDGKAKGNGGGEGQQNSSLVVNPAIMDNVTSHANVDTIINHVKPS